MMNKKVASLALLMGICGHVSAQTCLSSGIETTPESDFSVVSDSTYLHDTTDLVWKRCAEGQTWDGTTCDGEAVKYTWQEALQLAHEASNEDLLGWTVGLGTKGDLPYGNLYYKAEVTFTDFEDYEGVSNGNRVVADLDDTAAKFSIGYKF